MERAQLRQLEEGNGVRIGEADRFADLKGQVGDNIEAHHMPQDKLGFASRADGGALAMDKADHALTRTYGGKGIKTQKEDAHLTFEQALQKDIDDIRGSFGDKYDAGIQKLTDYWRSYWQAHPPAINK